MRVFEPKTDKMAEGWKRLHNEELHNLYTSPDIIRVNNSGRTRWTEHVALMGEMINVYKIFDVKPERKRPLGRHSRK
jgi:hypothetical protein